ncbi:MAG TPA: SDR family NAD(P)-dependent oxidoreductase [Silvibacterium sp.]|nr:SDR family NAD(P)-dependent oxidoreductase [Silvibacterium sp.]
MNIAEKTVLITGANRGVGEALVKEALNRGAKRVFAGTRGALRNTDPRVTALTLDVTNASQIQRAVEEVADLDVLINNAAISIYGDLTNLDVIHLTDIDVIQKHLDVNLLGPLKVTQAFLPLLVRSKGAVVNILSVASIAPVAVLPGYSISKAAALSLTQSQRALLTRQGVGVHGVILGSVDTDMSRDFDVPKVSPESAAVGIFDGLENGEEEIFPDPTSQPIADGWRAGVAKALERRINAVILEGAQVDITERL